MLLLHINRKPCGEFNSMITFDLSDIERSISRSLRFWRLISRKGAQLGHVLLLNANRKSYMGGGRSPRAASHLTLSDLERSNRTTQILKAYAVNEHRPYDTNKSQYETIYESNSMISDLSEFKRSVKVTQIFKAYISWRSQDRRNHIHDIWESNGMITFYLKLVPWKVNFNDRFKGLYLLKEQS